MMHQLKEPVMQQRTCSRKVQDAGARPVLHQVVESEHLSTCLVRQNLCIVLHTSSPLWSTSRSSPVNLLGCGTTPVYNVEGSRPLSLLYNKSCKTPDSSPESRESELNQIEICGLPQQQTTLTQTCCSIQPQNLKSTRDKQHI